LLVWSAALPIIVIFVFVLLNIDFGYPQQQVAEWAAVAVGVVAGVVPIFHQSWPFGWRAGFAIVYVPVMTLVTFWFMLVFAVLLWGLP
jgi:hypothetical protein